MIKVEIIPGKDPMLETVRFLLPSEALDFPSHLEARKWQLEKIFGKNPDFSSLSSDDEAYLADLLAESDVFSTKLIVGDPCRIMNLRRILSKLGKQNCPLETFLVEPKIN